jgi:hypothetical protein
MVQERRAAAARGGRQDSRSRCRHRPVVRRLHATTEITGIDLSAPIRSKARRKVASRRYPFVKNVRPTDAHPMTFAGATIDCVVAQFVIALVASPEPYRIMVISLSWEPASCGKIGMTL